MLAPCVAVRSAPAAPAAPAAKTEPRAKGPPVRKDGTIFAESELMGTRVSVNVWAGDAAGNLSGRTTAGTVLLSPCP